MRTITEYAYAKLNLSLDVISKMPDGYHEMRMVMQTVSLCDDVKIAVKDGESSVRVRTDKPFLPGDEGNIAGRAARIFLSAADISDFDIDIIINKRIPVCAGLGGGSADAAAVLRGLNRIFCTEFSQADLESMGLSAGADVPFCISGGTSLAEGKGEILTSLPPLPDCFIVICKPQFSISTPELFSRIKCDAIKLRPDTDGILSALKDADFAGIVRRLYNVFEDVLGQKRETIDVIKSVLYDHSSRGAAMSGTGSAVFGIFEKKEDAEAAYSQLSTLYSECFITKNVPMLAIEV
ncbi:MAG: 4-(cytidine 5'-diphospho)-2-C-methyl-D-erythritol kinase [Oscillospiraceae bacterium]